MKGLEVEIVDDADDRQVLPRPPDPELLADRVGEPEILLGLAVDDHRAGVGRVLPRQEPALGHADVQDLGEVLVAGHEVHVQRPLASTPSTPMPQFGVPHPGMDPTAVTPEDVRLLLQALAEGLERRAEVVDVVDDHDVVLVEAEPLVLDEVELPADDERSDDEEDGHGELEDDQAVAERQGAPVPAAEPRALEDLGLFVGREEESRIEAGQDAHGEGQSDEPGDDPGAPEVRQAQGPPGQVAIGREARAWMSPTAKTRATRLNRTDSPRNWPTSWLFDEPTTLRMPTSRARRADRAVARLTKLMPAMTRMRSATRVKRRT